MKQWLERAWERVFPTIGCFLFICSVFFVLYLLSLFDEIDPEQVKEQRAYEEEWGEIIDPKYEDGTYLNL